MRLAFVCLLSVLALLASTVRVARVAIASGGGELREGSSFVVAPNGTPRVAAPRGARLGERAHAPPELVAYGYVSSTRPSLTHAPEALAGSVARARAASPPHAGRRHASLMVFLL